LTHGVGAIRKYSIGAVLLDKEDPAMVLGRSREPLVRPDGSKREGYVPNVVYTCGAIRHNDQIVLPYAVSDTFSNFATIKIAALMQVLEGWDFLSRCNIYEPKLIRFSPRLRRAVEEMPAEWNELNAAQLYVRLESLRPSSAAGYCVQPYLKIGRRSDRQLLGQPKP
jgi:hypothetical protein